MDEIKDKALEGKGALGDAVSVDPFTDGLYIAGLSKEQVESFGSFINDLYQKIRDSNKKRQITRNALTMFKGAIFALGTKKLSNPEWKEHCASSLREVFHEWDGEGQLGSDFVKFFKNENGENKLNDEEKETMKTFWNHYKYFSGIDHHNASAVQGALIALLKDNNLKLEDCYKKEVFIERVKGFFSDLSTIIKYSKNSKK